MKNKTIKIDIWSTVNYHRRNRKSPVKNRQEYPPPPFNYNETTTLHSFVPRIISSFVAVNFELCPLYSFFFLI